jgi:hypothetical protein
MTKVVEDVEYMATHVCDEGLSAPFHRKTDTRETTTTKKEVCSGFFPCILRKKKRKSYDILEL